MFKEKEIGLPDLQKEKEIIKLYDEICTNANSLFWNLEFYLDRPDKINLNLFFEFLNSKEPKQFLYVQFIECKDLKFPGINVSKIIEHGLVDVPAEKFNELLKDRIELLEIIEKAKALNFYFPLAKLFNETNRAFAVSSIDSDIESKKFDELVYRHVRKFTSNEKENEAIEALEEAVNALNKLINLGLIQNHPLKWKTAGINSLLLSIVFDHNSDNPLSLKPEIKRLMCWSNLFTDKTSDNPAYLSCDILKFF